MLHPSRNLVWAVGLAVAFTSAGCLHRGNLPEAVPEGLPRELNKVTLPEYVVEPPDILQINAVQLVPLPPYRVQSLDTLAVQVPNALPIAPIGGLYAVDPEGNIDLGPSYGVVSVAGLTLAEAKAAVVKQLRVQLKDPEVSVSIAQSRGLQQIAGGHLVRTDGTVDLGTYGSVPVTGLTLTQAREQIEARLARFLQSPQVTVDVLAYNSKVFYIIFDGGGNGLQIYRLPITGNDTVLDALSQVYGLGPVSNKHALWVARPSPSLAGCDQVLPVDLVGIITKGRTETNYQLLPGDRLYVKAKPLIAIDTALARFLAPAERLFGFTLLGSSVIRQLQSFPASNNGTTGP
ncbi:MAG: hypothetical protein JWO38_5487 [Gemmataceae bacterium]|nr:hypothetical protein [Gemmataceae bacterium]